MMLNTKQLLTAPAIFLVVTLLMSVQQTAYACAQDDEQAKQDSHAIHLIESLYANLNDSRGFLFQHATPDFKAMFDRDDKLAQAGMGIACLDYDMVVRGQDYNEQEIKNSLKVTKIESTGSNQIIRASFTNFDEPIVMDFKLVCDDQKCQFDDIITEQGSTKQGINQCLEEF